MTPTQYPPNAGHHILHYTTPKHTDKEMTYMQLL